MSISAERGSGGAGGWAAQGGRAEQGRRGVSSRVGRELTLPPPLDELVDLRGVKARHAVAGR